MRTRLLLPLLVTACAHPMAAEGPGRSIAARDARNLMVLEQGTATTLPARLEEEWQIVQALENAGLLNLAFTYAVPLAKLPEHPHHREAVELIVRLQRPRHDDFQTPSLLEKYPAPPTTSAPVMVQIAWLRARISFRRGRLEDALTLAAQVPPGNSHFPRAQYLMALALVDPRLSGGPRPQEALDVLARLLPQLDPANDADIGARALLALGRISYGLGRWAEAVRWYDEAAQGPVARTEALFEQSFVFLQQRQWARALALLRSPELSAAGFAELPVAEAIALHFSGDDLAAETSLARAREAQKDEVDWRTAEPARAVEACQTGRGVTSSSWTRVRQNRWLGGVNAAIASWEGELAVVENTAAWTGTGTGANFTRYLRQNLGVMLQLRESLCLTQFRAMQQHLELARSSAELMGIEVALGHRDLNLAIERAEQLLTRLPAKGAPTSDLLFRLAALKQARAEVLQGVEAEEERAQVSRLIGQILEGDPTWERLEEARHFLDAR